MACAHAHTNTRAHTTMQLLKITGKFSINLYGVTARKTYMIKSKVHKNISGMSLKIIQNIFKKEI